MAADGGCQSNVVHRMNDGHKAWGARKGVPSIRGLGINTKKCLYERIVPKALYRAQACGMRNAEGRKVNVLEMKCLRSLAGVSRMNSLE